MTLASNIPKYGSVELIDFDKLEPELVKRPPGARLRAWAKLEEVERRVDAFDWIVHSVREPGKLARFTNDFATAYLLSFEATLQIVLEEVTDGAHEAWLRDHESYDTLCRGLRTLRNLEAHIRAGRMTAAWQRNGSSRFRGGVDSGRTVAWQLPRITVDDLNSLKRSGQKLAESEVGEWNDLVESRLASDIMREGVQRLVPIITLGESQFGRSIGGK